MLGPFPGPCEGPGSSPDDNPAPAMEGRGAGASAGRRPEPFAMDGTGWACSVGPEGTAGPAVRTRGRG